MAEATSSSNSLVDKQEKNPHHPHHHHHHYVGVVANQLEELNKIISTLPKAKGFMRDYQYQYKGFWFHALMLNGTLIAQKQQYYYEDSTIPKILLATYPKSGTTWTKALLFAITTRTVNNINNNNSNHPLLTSNPNTLVPLISSYANRNPSNPIPENTSLLATHIPFHLLPNSIQLSTSTNIVYIYRDPKDVLISFWFFGNQVRSKDSLPPLSIHEAVDLFCDGKSPFGPYWDHLQSYRESKRKVMFMSYEEMMIGPIESVIRLAEFVGCPFTDEEVKDGVPECIVDLCSFKKMKDLEVNQPQEVSSKSNKIANDMYFRKGEIGDYRNHLSDEMIHRIDEMTRRRCGGIHWNNVDIVLGN